MKGKTAYGCSAFKDGCDFKINFEQFGKKLTDKQLEAIITKGKTSLIKDFEIDGAKVNGKVVLNEQFMVEFEKES